MDTKARLLIIVGGVVLVGMVAWQLMPSGGSPSAEAPTEPAVEVPPAVPTVPATEPYAAVDPFAPTTTVTTPMQEVTSPSITPADTTDAWARALDGGTSQVPHGTTTHSLPANYGFSSNFSQSGSAVSNATVIPAAPSAPAADKPTSYVVASGDSLYSISEKIYGSGKHVNKIIAANPGIDPKRLKVGQSIKLPDVTDTAAATPARATSAVTPSARTYTVQSGDNLRKIATKLYGDAAKWEKLYAANRTLIGSDPSHLRAGMVLQVPAN